jgi:hypothetical protein
MFREKRMPKYRVIVTVSEEFFWDNVEAETEQEANDMVSQASNNAIFPDSGQYISRVEVYKTGEKDA